MNKKICFAVILIGFILVLTPCAAAETPEEYAAEQAASLNIDSVLNALPEDVKAVFNDLGLDDFNFEKILQTSPKSLFTAVKEMAYGVWKKPCRILAETAVMFILASLVVSASPDDGGAFIKSTQLFTVSFLTALILPGFAALISHASSAVCAENIFIKSYMPVLLAVAASSGNPALAFGTESLTLGAAELIAQFTDSFLIPLSCVYISLNLANAAAPKFNLSGFINILKKSALFSLGFCATVFTGLLTTKGILAGAVDSASSKGVKFALSSFIPIIGNTLSDGLNSIVGGLTLLRSTVGIYGIIAAVFLIVPTFTEIAVWSVCLNICAAVGDLFEQDKSAALLRGFSGALTFLNAILLFQGMVLIVATGLILTIRPGG